jgi:DNA-binding Lrp family transcriptional regulator
MGNRSTVVIVNGRRYVKPGQVAQRLGVSRATVYRRLPELQAAGVEIIHASARVTLVNEDDLERHLMAKGLPDETMKRRLEALEQAQQIRALIVERYGMAPDGWAAQAVREFREEFGA